MTNQSVDTAVVIPARNEEQRIAACLTSLLAQCPDHVRVMVVLNNTSDATAQVVNATVRRVGKPVEVLSVELPADQGVGTARRLGCAHAIRLFPNLRFLLNTDADGIAAPDWISSNLAQLHDVDAVCGAIRPIPSEAPALTGTRLQFAEWEGRYRHLVLDWYHRFAPEAANPLPHHGEASGASLAIRFAAYQAAGGFEDVKTGEDRAMVRRLKTRGFGVRHASDVVMQVSCRLTGRAPGGMADALRDRIGMQAEPYLIDEALPPFHWLSANIQTPGIWPPAVPPDQRLFVDQLPDHIRNLGRLLSNRQLSKPLREIGTEGATYAVPPPVP